MAAKPEPVLPKEEEHEEDAKSEKEEYCSDGWRGSDFFSDACSVKSDEYSDDEGQRAAAALLFKTLSIYWQTSIQSSREAFNSSNRHHC